MLTYWGNFAIYTYIKSLSYTPKTNTILCQLYLNKKKKHNEIPLYSY